jgi:ABC-type Fe3+/spermidine/putrescine transport system ATPase subunit
VTLEARGLTYTFPGYEPTLRGASLAVERGQSGFLLGPSGGGKTTLLRCIAGLEQAYGGSVRWDAARLDGLPPHARRIGMLFQEPALFPHLRVWQNVAFGLRYRAVPRGEERAEAGRWLAHVGLEEHAAKRIDELSGGQRQRVALVRTLAARPRAVLLDEPFSALDRDLRDELGPWVKGELRAQQVAALWVTHDRDEARRWGDRVWELRDGVCVGATP